MSHLPEGFSRRRLTWRHGSGHHVLRDSRHPKRDAWILLVEASGGCVVDVTPDGKVTSMPLAEAKLEAERLYVAMLVRCIADAAEGV